MVACPKPPKIIRDPQHLRMVRQLPCCLTWRTHDVECHHLLRTGEHAMGRRSGDNWGVPLAAFLHRQLHDGPLDEKDFFAKHGGADMAPLKIANRLYMLTERGLKGEEWLSEGRKVIE